MTTSKHIHSARTKSRQSHELSAAHLSRTIFDAELPEQFIKEFSAQSLFLAVKHCGLESSGDLLQLASVEQCQLILDFDLWNKDLLDEHQFWRWLELADEDDSIEFLQKLLKCVDLKLIALIIARHADIIFSDEPTNEPPAPRYYTPDGGRTWIGIKLEDGLRHFLLGKLLALIFESNAELFYQLIAISSTHTETMLEEEAFADRTRRISAEGIPDSDLCASLHRPIYDNEIKELLATSTNQEKIILAKDIRPVEPLVYQPTELEPFESLVSEALHNDEFQSELTLIMNAALVHFKVDLSEYPEIVRLTEKVRGAINIALEHLINFSGKTSIELYQQLGLQRLYRLGISKLRELQRHVHALRQSTSLELGCLESAGLDALQRPFPEFLEALTSPHLNSAADVSIASDTSISSDTKAFEHLRELDSVREIFAGIEPANKGCSSRPDMKTI